MGAGIDASPTSLCESDGLLCSLCESDGLLCILSPMSRRGVRLGGKWHREISPPNLRGGRILVNGFPSEYLGGHRPVWAELPGQSF
jgi:hypothetical protein